MFDLISDIHIDVPTNLIKVQNKLEFLKKIEKAQKNNYLIVAGDISDYYDDLIRFSKHMSSLYSKIFFVFGNHDFYINNTIENKKFSNSWEKLDSFKQENIDNIYVLDGDVFDVEGFKVGGTTGWYDGMYTFKNLNPYFEKDNKFIQNFWKESIDAKYIKGVSHYQELIQKEKNKLINLSKEVDIMVTHMNPSIKPEHTEKHYRKSDNTSFYTFDGKTLRENGNMFAWIYGHTHNYLDYEENGVECINAFPMVERGKIIMKELKIDPSIYKY